MKVGDKVIRAAYQPHLGYVAYFTEATIEAIYKNGNVLIKGTQYRPTRDGKQFHRAGRDLGYNRSYFVLLDDDVRKRHAENVARQDRQRRLRALQDKVANLRDIDEARLAMLEAVFS